MAETAIAAVAVNVATQVAGKAANLYNQADEPTKTRIATSVGAGTLGIGAVAGLPRTLILAAINFFILSAIFIGTLFARYRALFRAGDASYENYTRNAFLRGMGLALAAAVIFAITDFLSGGTASLVMLLVYPLAGIGMLILSLIAPSFLNDITEPDPNNPDATRSRISAFRLWSVAFWPIFIIGMLVSLLIGGLVAYLGTKISRLVLDMLGKLAGSTGGQSTTGGLASSLGSLFSSVNV